MNSAHAYWSSQAVWERTSPAIPYERSRFLTAVGMVSPDVGSVLDVGCGNGSFLSIVEQQRPEIRCSGVERYAAASSKLCAAEIRNSDLAKLPFPDRSFDLVASMAVLEHIPAQSIEQCMGELARVSRKYLLINLPYKERRARFRCPECNCSFDPHLHLRSYGRREIDAMFASWSRDSERIMKGNERIIPYVAQRILRAELSSAHAPDMPCPQCGYVARRSAPAALSQARADPRSILRRIWELQPTIKIEREIFLLLRAQPL